MASSQWRGMDELSRLFDTLPASAEADIRQVLPEAAATVLAIQKDDAPVRTGDLWHGLSIQQLNGGLTVRAGLVSSTSSSGKTSYGPLFYGRIVEQGRKAQTVLVERRRRVGGQLRVRRGKKVAGDIAAAYRLRVSPEPARPFVDTPQSEAAALGAMETIADLIQGQMGE